MVSVHDESQAEAADTAPAPVLGRLEELRRKAGSDPDGVRDEAFRWVLELGKSIASDRRRSLGDLKSLFAAGTVPQGLDGQTEGRLVGWATIPAVDRIMAGATGIWLPWLGKYFDSANASGYNLMSGPVRYAGRIVWPAYRMLRPYQGRTRGFEFTTAAARGKLGDGSEVLAIEYDTVPSNPRFVIRSVLDELVELVPGAYLGQMLWRSGSAERARYTMLCYFALRQPQGAPS